MRNRILIIFLVLLVNGTFVFSQNYEKVDSVVRNYPSSFKSTAELAELIKKDFSFPEEKARAIFTWIALNIEYDVKAYTSSPKNISYSYKTQEEKLIKEQKFKDELVKQTLHEKKAVCEGYSTLYKSICDLVSIECKIIRGASKTKNADIGKIAYSNDHAWNVVKINNSLKLVDVTWGAGYVNKNITHFTFSFNDFYFFSPPERFFLNHYPENKDFLFIKMSKKKFANLPLYYSYYFQKDIEVIKPRKGIISIPKNNKIKLVIKNKQKEIIWFNLENEKFTKSLIPKIDGELYTYEITLDKRLNTYLMLSIDNMAVATFKLIN